MLGKLKVVLDLFRRGNAVADPVMWKQRQITATMLAGLFIAASQAAKVFGYDFPMDSETATVIGAGIIGVVNWVLTIVTSKKIGALPAKPDDDSLPSPTEAASEDVQINIDSDIKERAIRWAAEQQQREDIYRG